VRATGATLPPRWSDAHARCAAGVQLRFTRNPRRLVGLAVAFPGGHRLTHHPFASFPAAPLAVSRAPRRLERP
jgi:hypothetical protein